MLNVLKNELDKQSERLTKERKITLEVHTKELAERESAKQKAIAERKAQIKADEEKWEKIRREKELAEQIRIKEENESRVKLELEQNAKEQALIKEREELDQLTKEAENSIWLEEKYRLTLESEVKIETPDIVGDNSHIYTGEAAIGTGGLEVGPDMSQHLKRILRQI